MSAATGAQALLERLDSTRPNNTELRNTARDLGTKFWSVQARSVRAENHALNERLLEHIERALPAAGEKVQWNVNWCAAQIGIADERLRGRCIALGERLGLYRDFKASKGCTSPYLPAWIGSVVGKQAAA